MKKICIAAVFFIVIGCSPVAIAKPADTPTATSFVVPSLPEATPAPTRTPFIVSPTPSPTPTPVPEDLFYVVQPNDTLTSIAKQFGLTVEYLAGTNSIADPNTIWVGQVLKLKGVIEIPTPTITNGKQIILKLSVERVYPFENGQLAHSPFIVSTGISAYPTRLGEFHIWAKLVSTRMKGPGYNLPDVPWTMYFDEDRGFHGKYWNKIYGRPSSHGCVNMTIPDAKWLYDWAPFGTDVLVIP